MACPDCSLPSKAHDSGKNCEADLKLLRMVACRGCAFGGQYDPEEESACAECAESDVAAAKSEAAERRAQDRRHDDDRKPEAWERA